ncbi:sperm-egg fusion protein TMEM95 isoform X3 [Canis lupus baileyi]|uniref:sperm-egg fusion protein TMEM95 isoform X1 n=1 Tax=Canis lupus familiaris TaxID=9615 RepID=UPI000BAA1A63|nr:sperm-egg fusion protein TMEM95 isoform X1 [Canis lupus familiaris]XP_025284386.3 sperm-egg fusion protein TMEM95 isoform X1 [Canis lupus dingo]XP_038392595.1 sperm-egg fusion protein TMEM95 isoform X1 [Canis lupus familiaris]XP_038521318.1 sperm-egg fusion protein TMEM95 isoform X1 [Canis lupus familiaris]|eukprot:XP_022274211.1 transmembrane protein 95 isoform X1 [Canis lupus familiaris]
MWVLALGGVFLATTQACILCQLSARDLSGRLAHVCSQVEAKWKDCGASWNFPAFALDEVSMNRVIEKTHRVLRVMEIKGSFSSLPLYQLWLQKIKLPQYTREALCAPACRGRTTLYNCSTCQSTQVQLLQTKRGPVKTLPASQPPLLKGRSPPPPLPLEGISQPFSSHPEGSAFHTLKPNVPKVPGSDGLWGPRHPQGEHSPAPPPQPSTNQMGAVTDSRKISTEGKNPLQAPPLPHPLLPILGSGGWLPQKLLLGLL